MAKMNSKVLDLAIASVVMIPEENVREPDINDYDRNTTNLYFDIKENGLRDPLTVHKRNDGTYRPLKGNRRIYVLTKLANEGAIDPTTAKRDDQGNIIPGTGKPFSTVKAVVYEGLTEQEQFELVEDHAQIEPLRIWELYRTFEMAWGLGMNERKTVVRNLPLLMQYYQPSREIKPIAEDGGQDALNNYKGVIDAYRNAYRGAYMVRDAYIEKLKGKQKWPTNDQLKHLAQVFVKEVAKDKTLTYSKSNPGPEFLAEWEKLQKNIAEAAAKGTTRPEPITAMNRGAMDEVGKAASSMTLRTTMAITISKLPRSVIPKFDALLVRMEKNELTGSEYLEELKKLVAAGSDAPEAIIKEEEAPKELVGA